MINQRYFFPEGHKGGWFIGNFPEAVLTTPNFEVSYKEFKAGEKSDGHHHTKSTEYNLVVKGMVAIGGFRRTIIGPGTGFIYYPYDKSDVEFVEDSALVVIRVPSVNDKEYDVEKKDDGSDSGKLPTGKLACCSELC